MALSEQNELEFTLYFVKRQMLVIHVLQILVTKVCFKQGAALHFAQQQEAVFDNPTGDFEILRALLGKH